MEQILVPLALLANGIGVGVMASTVIGLAPMTLAVPYDRYVETIQFLWRRYDPFMPIMNAVACLVNVVLMFTATGLAARILFGTAAALLVLVMTISVVKNVPINRYVMSLDPRVQPTDWAQVDPRVRWRNWNAIRTTLALVALVVNAAAVAVLL